MSAPRFARVAVNITQLTGLFDYAIPEEWQDQVKPGSLVTIPFGRQLTQGIVLMLTDDPAVPNPKALDSLVEKEAVVTPQQIKLAQWMADENLSSLSACLELMLPPGLSQHADILVHLVELPQDGELTPLQNRIISLLQKRGDLHGKQLDHSLPHMDWRKSLPGLVKKGIVLSSPILKPPSAKAKTGRAVKFAAMPETDEALKSLGKTGSAAHSRRLKALQFLQNEQGEVKLPFVYAETGANAADLTKLAELEFIEFSEVEIQRDPLAKINPVNIKPPQLTAEQASVVERLKQQLNGLEPNLPNLLQGVTSSGKTEVYLHAVEEALRLGKQAIILVPEISLTPQTVNRFLGRFPGRVGLIHSKLSDGERYDTWRRIRSGEICVVVGARSALFAPLNNLGLIVIDECHDGSYHQEDVEPRYQAVGTAIAYARLTNAILIMGSATPEVEQRFLFKQNKWNIFELPNRVLAHQALYPDASEAPAATLPMPDVEVVDMRGDLVAGNRSPLSRALQIGITEVLERGSQAILFLNRRGSASYVFCRDCGHVLRCSRCNTPMTFHEHESLLVCHQCNAKRQMPQKCPQCGSSRIKQFGLGTESLQKMIAEQFPKARTLRWDADTARKKGAHDLIMDQFARGRADLLIGTQMIAKGLDLPNVTLVGVVLADVSLNLPDFRAAERTYQLITQVAGRAGRSSLGGKVILQTFQPEHYAIQKAAAYDFAGFEKTELQYRQQTGYPPYAKLLKIELSHYNASQLERAAVETGECIRHWLFEKDWEETVMIGPSPCFYQRSNGRYRWQILLRGHRLVDLMRAHPLATWQPAGVQVEITVDPVNLL